MARYFFSTELGESLPEYTPAGWSLLRAAIRVLSERGPNGARTRTISEEAGISEKTLFAVFGTKDQLIAAACVVALRDLFGESPPEVSGPTFLSRLQRSAALHQVRVREHPHSFRLLLRQLVGDAQYRSLIGGWWVKRRGRQVILAVRRAVERGELRDVDPERVTRLIMSIAVGYAMVTALYPEWIPADQDEDELEALFDLLLRGIGASTTDAQPERQPRQQHRRGAPDEGAVVR